MTWCDECGENIATLQCKECKTPYCEECAANNNGSCDCIGDMMEPLSSEKGKGAKP